MSTYKPIVLKETEEKIVKILEKENEMYPLIFLLMIYTGVPYNHCIIKSVEELKQPYITYPCKSRQAIHKVPIPEELQQLLKKSLSKKHDLRPAFLSDYNSPMPKYLFLQALKKASNEIDVPLVPSLQFQSLKKTFIYKMYHERKPLHDIKSLSSIKSYDELKAYLHLGEYYDGEIKEIEKKPTSKQKHATIKAMQDIMTYIVQNKPHSDEITMDLNGVLIKHGFLS